MKRKLLIGLAVASMSFTGMSYADFTFYSSSTACEDAPGNWVGSGKAYNWLIGECVYNGSGTVGPVDSAGNFSLEVIANKRSGSFVCPEHTTTKLNGVCINGVVKIKTEYGDLAGNFTKTTGNAKGSLTVSPGIDVDVSVQFNRAG